MIKILLPIGVINGHAIEYATMTQNTADVQAY